MRAFLILITLPCLLSWADPAPKPKLVVRTSEAPTHRIADGKGTATLFVNASTGSPDVALTKLELQPGAKVPEHTHESGEWLSILSGTAEFEVDGQPLVAREGDAIYIPKGLKHRASVPADAKTPLIALQVYSPAGAEQRFTKGPLVESPKSPAR